MTVPHLRRACEQVTIAAWDTPLKVAVTELLVSLVMMENRGSEASGVSSPVLFHSPHPPNT